MVSDVTFDCGLDFLHEADARRKRWCDGLWKIQSKNYDDYDPSLDRGALKEKLSHNLHKNYCLTEITQKHAIQKALKDKLKQQLMGKLKGSLKLSMKKITSQEREKEESEV